MENQIIKNRLSALRNAMQENGIDFYMIPTGDYHGSEYVDDHFKTRQFFSNFSGSSGILIVGAKEAGLWTDGRYFIQAEKELEGTGVTLYRAGQEGVPTREEYLKASMEKGQILGFDGKVVDTATGKNLEKTLSDQEIKIVYDKDLAGQIWTDRPKLPCNPVMVLDEEICGETAGDKIARLREKMNEKNADGHFLSRLDEIMWLFNIRGKDISCNPVAFSYAYVTKDSCHLFVQNGAVTEEFAAYAKKYDVTLHDYFEVSAFIQEQVSGLVLCELGSTTYAFYKMLGEKAEIIDAANPTNLMKACKNDTEVAMMREAYLKDSAALCKFIYWLKQNVGKIKITEMSAAAHLDHLRSCVDGYLDLSFPTISAYREDAAMMHYSATPEHDLELAPEGLYLVDSGGQYLGGTTDVTRTIALGPVSDEIKTHFTAVAMGMLALSDARFLHGCAGRNLDILARGPLWDMNIDYRCGTGHGIGYILNVHEGPQGMRWKYAEGVKEAVLEEGMTMTNEPGVYVEGSHGIRTENVLVVRKGEKNEYGQFMYFENLTFAPIDLDAIDVSMMSARDIARLNAYHTQVREKITPYLNKEEAEWLAVAARNI
ncbi:MAG: aminopeptidase P family protein [Lachnospiraceae bacterium]|nr:aminopeptidase P family protein [Lachnospiraceae bacterium]